MEVVFIHAARVIRRLLVRGQVFIDVQMGFWMIVKEFFAPVIHSENLFYFIMRESLENGYPIHFVVSIKRTIANTIFQLV